MAKSWYILQVYNGYEQKIERVINKYLEVGDLDREVVTNVKVPIEEVVDIKDGKKTTRKNLIIPGYVMLEMDLPQIGWKSTCQTLRKIQGVSGFVGTEPSVRPRPIGSEEAKNLMRLSGELKGEKTVRIKQNFEVGDSVKITEGPLATYNGTVEEVNAEKNKLRINVQIFGRATPVEVDLTQVEKI